MAPNPTTAYPTGCMSALAVGAALPLRTDRGVVESAEFFDVLQDLENRVYDGVDFLLVAQEKIVREPDGLVVSCALGDGAAVHVAQIERLLAFPAQRGILRRVHRKQRAPIHRLVKKPVAWDAFQL